VVRIDIAKNVSMVSCAGPMNGGIRQGINPHLSSWKSTKKQTRAISLKGFRVLRGGLGKRLRRGCSCHMGKSVCGGVRFLEDYTFIVRK
jgi:hypothetical protein